MPFQKPPSGNVFMYRSMPPAYLPGRWEGTTERRAAGQEKEAPVGKEVISRFTTGIRNAGVSYTDSNAREMLRREL